MSLINLILMLLIFTLYYDEVSDDIIEVAQRIKFAVY